MPINDDYPIPSEYQSILQPIRDEQIKLASKLILESKIRLSDIKTVAGFDTAFDETNNLACAGVVTVDISTLETIEEHFTYFTPAIPYISTFLAYREAPGYRIVYKELEEKPDILFFDGNGIIHPFSFGIASQMGLEFNKPSTGIAKKLLFGDFAPPIDMGGFSHITYKDKVIGAAYQSAPPPTKPIFVSQGHLIDLITCINVIREFTYNQKYQKKLPLPLFLADQLAKEKIGKS
ncbi:MAG: endonuclease V [Asgard group archaeon]|nr:endonuclease V [Asgard group archaeon]